MLKQVVRILIYQGPEEWIQNTLARSLPDGLCKVGPACSVRVGTSSVGDAQPMPTAPVAEYTRDFASDAYGEERVRVAAERAAGKLPVVPGTIGEHIARDMGIDHVPTLAEYQAWRELTGGK